MDRASGSTSSKDALQSSTTRDPEDTVQHSESSESTKPGAADCGKSAGDKQETEVEVTSESEKPEESREEAESDSEDETDRFLELLTRRLHLGAAAGPEEKPKILETVDFDGIIRYILSGKCKNIITISGAGMSTSAGIPDFRSPGSGLYANLSRFNLPVPEAVFDISFFRENPQPFFTLAKDLYPSQLKPTICHRFIRLLEQKGLLLRHYTQNIDTLEHLAGVSEEKIVEAHGSFHTSHCTQCQRQYDQQWMKDQIFQDSVPTCESCNGVVKPDIVFFGEALPTRFFRLVAEDFPRCDLLIVVGTSLVVQPFASLVDRVPDTCPRLLINKEKTGQSNALLRLLGGAGGMDFDSEDNYRDVAWLGACDDGAVAMATALGWMEDLQKLVDEAGEAEVKQDKAGSSPDPGGQAVK